MHIKYEESKIKYIPNTLYMEYKSDINEILYKYN